jgi:hypothetical protein
MALPLDAATVKSGKQFAYEYFGTTVRIFE